MTTTFETETNGYRLHGLRAGDGGDRGLVIALHGGGHDARYWHARDDDPGSLLAAGAANGFEVVAVDRPGYRASATPDAHGLSLTDQADSIFALIDALAPEKDRPVFLIGHSMGGILSVRMAGDPRAGRLTAVDVSGVPLRYPPRVEAGIATLIDATRSGEKSPSSGTRGHRRALFFGADGSFDPDITAIGGNPVPLRELHDAHGAPRDLPPIMARITIPVQWTIADQEASSVGGQAMLDHIRSQLPECRHTRLHLQVASGHNISLHHVARAYHLRALAFFEECLALIRAG